eukprot:87041_1
MAIKMHTQKKSYDNLEETLRLKVNELVETVNSTSLRFNEMEQKYNALVEMKQKQEEHLVKTIKTLHENHTQKTLRMEQKMERLKRLNDNYEQKALRMEQKMNAMEEIQRKQEQEQSLKEIQVQKPLME